MLLDSQPAASATGRRTPGHVGPTERSWGFILNAVDSH